MSQKLSQIQPDIVDKFISCLLTRSKPDTDGGESKPWFCPSAFVNIIQKHFGFDYCGIVGYNKRSNKFDSFFPSIHDKANDFFHNTPYIQEILTNGRKHILDQSRSDANIKPCFHYDYWFRKKMCHEPETLLNEDIDVFFFEINLPVTANDEIVDYYFLCLSVNDPIGSDTDTNVNENDFPLIALIDSWQHQIFFIRNHVLENNSFFNTKKQADKEPLLFNKPGFANGICVWLFNLQELLFITRNMVGNVEKKNELLNKSEKPTNSAKALIETLRTKCLDCPFIVDTEPIGFGKQVMKNILLKWAWFTNFGPFHLGPARRSDQNTDPSKSVCVEYTSDILLKFKDDIETISNFVFHAKSQNSSTQPFFLSRYFLQRVQQAEFDIDIVSNFVKDDSLSDEEVLQRLKHIVSISNYLYANFPHDDISIQSIIWLIDKYCHSTLQIHGRIDIKLHLFKAARGEPALHALKKYYRDHFFHAIEVCFLGHFLLELKISVGNSKKTLWEIIATQFAKNHLPGFSEPVTGDHKRVVLHLWYLTALLHDIGYYIDIQKSIIDSLKFFEKSPHLKEFQSSLKSVLQKLSENIAGDYFVQYKEKDKPAEDHGVIGALHLFDLIQSINKEDKSVKPDAYEPAIRAIALHNSRKHQVSFAKDPLAFLLILCDTVQEWNRPKFNFSTVSIEILSKFINSPENSSVQEKLIENFEINAKPDIQNKCFQTTDEACIKLFLTCNREIHLNHSVFNMWIDSTCNLQRLSFEGLPEELDFKLEHITPFYRDQDGNPYYQFYRLRDAAQETHMGFLNSWFPEKEQMHGNKKVLSNGAVTYSHDKLSQEGIGGQEHLTLNLRELCKKKPITSDVDEFRTKLSRWRSYYDDLEFKGDYGAPDTP